MTDLSNQLDPCATVVKRLVWSCWSLSSNHINDLLHFSFSYVWIAFDIFCFVFVQLVFSFFTFSLITYVPCLYSFCFFFYFLIFCHIFSYCSSPYYLLKLPFSLIYLQVSFVNVSFNFLPTKQNTSSASVLYSGLLERPKTLHWQRCSNRTFDFTPHTNLPFWRSYSSFNSKRHQDTMPPFRRKLGLEKQHFCAHLSKHVVACHLQSMPLQQTHFRSTPLKLRPVASRSLARSNDGRPVEVIVFHWRNC